MYIDTRFEANRKTETTEREFQDVLAESSEDEPERDAPEVPRPKASTPARKKPAAKQSGSSKEKSEIDVTGLIEAQKNSESEGEGEGRFRHGRGEFFAYFFQALFGGISCRVLSMCSIFWSLICHFWRDADVRLLFCPSLQIPHVIPRYVDHSLLPSLFSSDTTRVPTRHSANPSTQPHHILTIPIHAASQCRDHLLFSPGPLASA